MQVRSFCVAVLLASSTALGACAGSDSIEYEPDSKDVKRGAAPSWQEPGATPPEPPVVIPPEADGGLDAGVTPSDAAAPDASDVDAAAADAGGDAGGDAGDDAALPPAQF